jgi:hypothetical protein
VETQPITDDLLPARELAFDAGSFVIAAVALLSGICFSGCSTPRSGQKIFRFGEVSNAI